MRKLLVVADCIRYEYAEKFNFDGFQHLSKVVSVSNWSMPVVATFLTGLHPLEHKVGLRLCMGHPLQLTLLKAVGLLAYREISHPMLIDKYPKYKIVAETPVYDLATPDGYASEVKRANEFEGMRRAEEFLDDPEVDFLIYHSKGGHHPYAHAKGREYEATKDVEEIEVNAVAREMNKFIEKARDKFDRIVVVTDHGVLWEGIDEFRETGFGHGGDYGLGNLHVPCWLYPNEGIPDVLYDTRVAYQFMEQEKPISRQLVLSTTPAYLEYNRFAVTYLVKNKLVSENYQTKEGYDFDEEGSTDKRGNSQKD